MATLVSLLAAASACSSSVIETTTPDGADAGVPDEQKNESDAAVADARAQASDAAKDTGIDAALPPEKVIVGSSTAGTSCAAVCTGSSYACSNSCTFGNVTGSVAGQVSYSRTVNTVTSYKYVGLSACTDVVAATYADPSTGSSYTLGGATGTPISCCCLGPGHTRIAGDPKAPRSCADICKSNGKTCDPATTWTFGDKGGWEAEYKCSATSTSFAQGTCDAIPPATKKTCPLDRFTCGCL